jgi:hypothetical protein
LTAEGLRVTVQPRLVLGADGWKSGSNNTHESLFCVAPTIVTPSKKVYDSVGKPPRTVVGKSQLRPLYQVLGLGWWQTGVHGSGAVAGAEGGYTSNAHAALLASKSDKVGLPPSRARIMDTTNGNPDVPVHMLREAVWLHAMYLECLQHVDTNAVKDLMEVPAFASAHDAAQALSTWLRRSTKRVKVRQPEGLE